MSDRLVYSDDPQEIIRMAREKGFSDEQIVTVLTRGLSYPECRALAEKYAEPLAVTEADFIRMAGPRS